MLASAALKAVAHIGHIRTATRSIGTGLPIGQRGAQRGNFMSPLPRRIFRNLRLFMEDCVLVVGEFGPAQLHVIVEFGGRDPALPEPNETWQFSLRSKFIL